MVLHLNKRRIIAFLAVISAVLILGAVIYNAATPSPTPTETPSPNPNTLVVPDDYPTITAAVGNAADGDTILIKGGTYEGPINQTIVIDKTLFIVGENAENTIINLYPAYSVSYILTQTYLSYSDAIAITADNCKLVNLTAIITPGGYISATGNGTEIACNNITKGPTSFLLPNQPRTRVSITGSHCKITDNVMEGIIRLNGSFNEVTRNSPHSIYVAGSSNLVKSNSCENLGLGNATNNIVLDNEFRTSTREYSGIDLAWSDNNSLDGNRVSGFSFGFRLWFSSGNVIVENTIADSLTASISFGGSSNNRIYLNNFIDNPAEYIPYVYDFYTDPNYRNAFPNMTPSTNFWDNSTIGNYWSNYDGTDANGDGIGDTPYIIDENNRDNYPLMNIIPEFPSFLILPLFMTATLLVAIIYRRKRTM